jgi:HEAT repeat protein
MAGARERLLSVAVAWLCGTVDPTAALAELPPELILDAIEDAEVASQPLHDRVSLLHLASHDPRVRVRSQVAASLATLPTEAGSATEGLIAILASDPAERVRQAAGRALASLLRRSSPAERVELLSRWTLSERATDRAAIARALAERLPVLLGDVAIEQLATDSVREVRAAAFDAALARFDELPATYLKLARAGANDEDGRVRELAHRMLRRT